MEIDWSTLQRLRSGFLQGTAGEADYWRSAADLAQYDATFAQRIGWKWDFVLDDLARLGWRPPPGVALDWGCGSGVASRAFIDHFGEAPVEELRLWDRSPLAMDFAVRRAAEKLPRLKVQGTIHDAPSVLIVSHVFTELPTNRIEELLGLVARATSVLWVEPGTYETSLALIAIRERMRDQLNIVAPCPNQDRCSILAPGNESHWCHQFAQPPEFVFQDAFWSEFSRVMEIDLRSLPLSYLVLDRRPVAPLPGNAVRILGRPEVFKPHAKMLGCTAGELIDGEVARRMDPSGYRLLKKGRCPSLQIWNRNGTQIQTWEALDRSAPKED